MQSPWFGFGTVDSDERDSEDEMTLPGAQHGILTYQDRNETGALLDEMENPFSNSKQRIDETRASSIRTATTLAAHAELFQDSTATPKQISSSPNKIGISGYSWDFIETDEEDGHSENKDPAMQMTARRAWAFPSTPDTL
ncbi:hypothetical protein CYMTET_21658 [Cymbomonas tetramitiformis]|uniref:Uncharacterized protein n=1 Tax=Cymbomonas tetramitiformis TaxID=36881 RepID=A0AAE0G1R9_9CHLO|nr:hypothetical protein CYMTET_21658 [Cymbomonas tetramitiformis]